MKSRKTIDHVTIHFKSGLIASCNKFLVLTVNIKNNWTVEIDNLDDKYVGCKLYRLLSLSIMCDVVELFVFLRH